MTYHLKRLIFRNFEEDILPWWECDVEKHVVGSKVKSFSNFIVSKIGQSF